MDSEQLLTAALGTIVIIFGLMLFVRLPQGRERWVLTISYVLCGILFALWPPQSGELLDHATGIAGLGMLLWAWATIIAIGLQVTMERMINERRLWWVRATPLLALGAAAISLALWVILRHTAGPMTDHLLYDGYHGDQPAILAWNVVIGLSIVTVDGLAARERFQGIRGNRPTLDARLMGGIYVVGVVYGCGIVCQAVASRLGYGATAIVPIVHLVRVSSIILATVLTIWTAVGLDLWIIGRHLYRLSQLKRQDDQLSFLLAVLSDRLVWRHAPYAITQLAQLTEQCVYDHSTARRLNGSNLLALQAARRITWRRGALVKTVWSEACEEDRQAADRSIASEAALDVAMATHPICDIGHVIYLALSEVALPAWLTAPLPRPTARHAAAAQVLVPYIEGTTAPVPTDNNGASASQHTNVYHRQEKIAQRPLARLHQALTARHAQEETNLLVMCELIEDYLLQIDAPDDDDLAVRVWNLESTPTLSPFQAEVAQRVSQLLGLFDHQAISLKPSSGMTGLDALFSRLSVSRRFQHYSHPEARIRLWCAIAAVTQAVLDPASIPVDGQIRHKRLSSEERTVARLICTAASETS